MCSSESNWPSTRKAGMAAPVQRGRILIDPPSEVKCAGLSLVGTDRMSRQRLDARRSSHWPTVSLRASYWRADGREIFYLAPGGGILSVEMTLSPAMKPGRSTELFRAHFPRDQRRTGGSYAVTADGQRFPIPTLSDAPPQSSITVILNWLTAVEEK